MSMKNICPEIHYRKTEKGIMITSCYGNNGNVILPDEIDGTLVTELAPYAFSEGGSDPNDLIWLSEEADYITERRHLKTTDVTEITLPQGIREIGRYAFYRCRNLCKMVLGDEILDIGGGALNGCKPAEVEIHFRKGEKSALKSIVEEIRFEVHAELYYYKENGEAEQADVLFPEHYEEAVENTPARILYTSHHGAGGYYRQCFYDRELDYKKYDEIFFRVKAEESVETALRLALGRVRFPYKLSESSGNAYMDYIKEHLAEAAVLLTETEDKEGLQFLGKENMWSEEALDAGIDHASKEKKTEILSMLMDEKHRLVPKKRKTFEL